QSLFVFDTSTGKTREWLTPEELLKGAEESLSPEAKARRERQRVSVGGFTDFQRSPDGAALFGLSGKLYLMDPLTGKFQQLPTGDGVLIDPKFAPDGQTISYVRNQDVCVMDVGT